MSDQYVHPDYWRGEWYDLLRAVVEMVWNDVRAGGTDPAILAPEDAWKQYLDHVTTNWTKSGMSMRDMPQAYGEFLQADAPSGAVFRAMWTARAAGMEY